MTNQKNKSFVIHTESLESIFELSDQQAGKLFKSIIAYQKTGELGKLDQILKFIINPLISQFKRDEEKYHNSIIQGKLGNLKKYHKPNQRLAQIENSLFSHNNPCNLQT